MTDKERLEKLQASCDHNRGRLEAIAGILAYTAKGKPVDVEALYEYSEIFDTERESFVLEGWHHTLAVFQEVSRRI